MSTKAVTSQRAAHDASEVLRLPRYNQKAKTAAGSALAQTPEHYLLKRLRGLQRETPAKEPSILMRLSGRYRPNR